VMESTKTFDMVVLIFVVDKLTLCHEIKKDEVDGTCGMYENCVYV
jgi:hypothetical protein